MDQLSDLLAALGLSHHYEKIKTSYRTQISLTGEIISIDLMGYGIRSLSSGTFDNYDQLQKIYLAWNKLENLPSDLFKLDNQITHLDLSGNRLSELNKEFFDRLSYLQNLQISDNHLTIFPNKVFESLRGLQELNLRNNQIQQLLSADIAPLISLERLYLYFNPMPANLADEDYYDKDGVDELRKRLVEYYN